MGARARCLATRVWGSYDSQARLQRHEKDIHRSGPPLGMSSTAAIFLNRLVSAEAGSRRDRIVLCLIATLHLAALIMMAATEANLVDKAAFLLVWAGLNFFWLALVRR